MKDGGIGAVVREEGQVEGEVEGKGRESKL